MQSRDDVDDSRLIDCQLGCRLDLDDPPSLGISSLLLFLSLHRVAGLDIFIWDELSLRSTQHA